MSWDNINAKANVTWREEYQYNFSKLHRLHVCNIFYLSLNAVLKRKYMTTNIISVVYSPNDTGV